MIKKFEAGSLAVVQIPCADDGDKYMIGEIGLIIDHCCCNDLVRVLIKNRIVNFTPQFLEPLKTKPRIHEPLFI